MVPIRFIDPGNRNFLQTLILIAGLIILLLLLGWLFAGPYGMVWAILIGVIPCTVGVWLYPNFILKMYRARPLTMEEAPPLHAVTAQLSQRAGLVIPPRLYVIPSKAPILFSTGFGQHGAIAATSGILQLLDLRELVGVLAHEISHIGTRDTLVMSFADVISRVTRLLSLLGQFLVFINLPLYLLDNHPLPWIPIIIMMIAPIFSALLQLALSRSREYGADLNAARITGDPEGLALALVKMEECQEKILGQGHVPGNRNHEPLLLRTHPPSEDRIKRLMALNRELYPNDQRKQFSCYELYNHRPPEYPARERPRSFWSRFRR